MPELVLFGGGLYLRFSNEPLGLSAALLTIKGTRSNFGAHDGLLQRLSYTNFK